MKRLIEETDDDGLLSLMGQRITFFCMNYIYTGKLVGVNDTCVKLQDAAVVYETGPFGDKAWKDAQPLPGVWYLQLNSIESFGRLKD